METGFNFLFFKICGRNRAAGATTSDLEDETLEYNYNCHKKTFIDICIYHLREN